MFWRDGLRWNDAKTAKVQRYLCRGCGLRFSEQSLNTQRDIQGSTKYAFERRETVTEATKNLEPVQKTKGRLFCAGDAKLSIDTKGLLTQFYAYLEKEAYSVESDYVDKVKHLAVLGANLRDPEHVKTVIGRMQRKTAKKPKTARRCCAAMHMILSLKCLSSRGIYQSIRKRTTTPLYLTKPN